MELSNRDEPLLTGKKKAKTITLHEKVIAHVESIAKQKDLPFGSVIDRILAIWITEKLKTGDIQPPTKKSVSGPKRKSLL